jgi:hypothetical protein
MSTQDTGWPHASGQVPASVRGIAARYPYRATLPKGTVPVASTAAFTAASRAAGSRLAVTEASDPSVIWVWARTGADAEAAEPHLEKLNPVAIFARHDGTGER